MATGTVGREIGRAGVIARCRPRPIVCRPPRPTQTLDTCPPFSFMRIGGTKPGPRLCYDSVGRALSGKRADCHGETKMMPKSPVILTSSRPGANAPSDHPALGAHARHAAGEPQVLACLDEDLNRSQVTEHARSISRALGLRLRFAQIVETTPHGIFPVDPVEWNLRLSECREDMSHLIEGAHRSGSDAKPVILTGSAEERLVAWAKAHRGSVMVLARHSGRQGHQGLGGTADRVLRSGAASVLLVPPRNGFGHSADYRKFLVPLDGSPSSESVLPIVVRLSRVFGAQVILAHISSDERQMAVGTSKNRHQAVGPRGVDRAYLETWASRLIRQDVDATPYFEIAAEPTEALRLRAAQLEIDLVILSSHGQSNLVSAPFGTVSGGLAASAPCPVLMVRPELQIPLGGNESSFATLETGAPEAELAP